MLVLLRMIANNTIAITQRHLERMDVRMTQPFQVFLENLRDQHTKSLKWHIQIYKLYLETRTSLCDIFFASMRSN